MERFWELLELHHAPAEEGFERLTRALSELDPTQIEGFAASLDRALAVLSTPAHASRHVRDVNEPSGSVAMPMSEDVFLYARCAVVAHGWTAWETVRRDPTALDSGWDIAGGEGLLEVAPAAYERATGLVWQPPGPRTAPNSRWFSHGEAFDRAVDDRPAFDWVTTHLVHAIDADAAWLAWWQPAETDRLQVEVFYSRDAPPTTRVRRGRDFVQVETTMRASILEPTDHAVLEVSARRALVSALELVQAELHLGEMPGLPAIAPPPADLPDAVEDADADGFPTDTELIETLVAAGMSREEAIRSISPATS
jgi:hypothetical protein